jgi:hypothetical protein
MSCPSAVPSEERLLEEHSPYYDPYNHDEHGTAQGLDDPYATSTNVLPEPILDSLPLRSLELHLQPSHASQRRSAAREIQLDSIPNSQGLTGLLKVPVRNAEQFQALSSIPGYNGERGFSLDIAAPARDISQEFLPRALAEEDPGYRLTGPWQQPQPSLGHLGESHHSLSPEAWGQRQATRRYPSRRASSHKGRVGSINHPVPSAIQNSVEKEYMNPSRLSEASEEFTHMRCKPHVRH